MSIKPITPEEIGEAKTAAIPDYVFTAVNNLIARKYTQGRSKFTQKEVIAEIQFSVTVDRSTLFDKGYLNFEEAYEDAGWSVKYDKPGYNESYAANFTFTKRSSK